MTPTFVISYLKKCHKILNELGHREDISVLRLWVDSVWSYMYYGCTIRQYVDGGFYRYSPFEREKVFTCRKYFKFMGAVNDKSAICYLEDKSLFNRHFANFVHRRWLTSKGMTEEDFAALQDVE